MVARGGVDDAPDGVPCDPVGRDPVGGVLGVDVPLRGGVDESDPVVTVPRARPQLGKRRRAARHLVGLLFLLLGGCGPGGLAATSSAPGASAGVGASSGAPGAGASSGSGRVVVTVPGLTSGDVSAASSAGASTGTTTVTATAVTSVSGGAPSTSGASAVSPAGATSGADVTSAEPPSESGSGTSGSTPAGQGPVTVDLATCTGCTVIATHAAVTGTLSAALATTARGAVLLSVRPGGAIAGVINVPYGATFPTPAGRALPCDRSGRCVITGRQANGNAILSAFELAADGSWRDVSGNDAFPSSNARGIATDVTGDGLLDIAIQETGGGLTTWMVLSWSGDRFAVLGCAPASESVPPAGQLSPDSCLS